MKNTRKKLPMSTATQQLAQTIFKIANNPESGKYSSRLTRIQKVIEEYNTGRDLAIAINVFLMNRASRKYSKNLKFDVYFNPDNNTINIKHVGYYIDEDEEEFDTWYAYESVHEVKVPKDNFTPPRNMITGNLVVEAELQKQLQMWLEYSVTLPDGKVYSTLKSEEMIISFGK